MSQRLTNAHLIKRIQRPSDGAWRDIYSDGTDLPVIAGGAPGDDETDDAGNVVVKDDPPADDDESVDDKSEEDDKDSDVPYKERMKAADRRAAAEKKRADELAARVKEIEDKDKTELERAQSRLAELEETKQELTTSLRNERVRTAFFTVNSVTWHDPEDALAGVDLSNVDVDDDGKVNTKQLKAAIKTLAERKPHWVKTDSSSEASGSQMNGKRKGESEKTDRAALEKDFPALKNR